MERLTNRIIIPKEERDIVVFTQGEYIDTIPAEMTHEDIRKVLRKLTEYEELEEQGLLLRLPCKVGDIVYEIHPLTGKITPRKIKSIVVCNCPDLIIMYKSGYDYSNVQDDFGKTVFLTQAEAEQKLKEMESD